MPINRRYRCAEISLPLADIGPKCARISGMNAETPTAAPGTIVVYDGDCPFCSTYVRMVRLSRATGPVTLVDARKAGHPVLDRIRAAGLNLDDGMVVGIGGQLYHGDRAMTVMAAMTSGSGLFNRVFAWVFRSPTRARLLYPPLVAGRNLTLRLLGRKKIGAG
jgi:predicted DCC family thiol-disulfide oxidoreductase YuxK